MHRKDPSAKARQPITHPQGKTPAEEIRPDAVARAKALVADPNYPSKQVLKAVAATLAKELTHPRKPAPKQGL